MIKLDNIFQILEPYILSIEETGSYTLPYIKNPHDRDIIIITKTQRDRAAAVKLYKKSFSIEERRQFKKENHIDIVFNSYPDIIDDRVYLYLTHYIKPLEGYEKMSIERPINTELYKSLIARDYSEIKEWEDYKNYKIWYHFYTGLCIIKHNSYELTEEEKNNINILHDLKAEENDKRLSLIEEIIEEIQSWQL